MSKRRAYACARDRTRSLWDDGTVEAFLYAFGDTPPSLPSTIRTLDEIITDFIIEACHEAALCASYSRRAKIKVDDFKFTLRKDGRKLGRVADMLAKDADMKKERRGFDFDDEIKAAKDDGGGEDEQQQRPRKKARTVRSEDGSEA
ncbi:MAG: Transcription initiation factor TFIID subunit 13 [Bathelium mastoideum]|nr:MAG: Transcription initiation factor TFIID subunit 13 [Bathelium mastoideum]KAI9686525.1 MAG: Transcription initiation factor TFIID subunit 13 [Bathelium mastoideum]